MVKYYFKKGIALTIMIAGIFFFMLGENFTVNNYWLERLVVATAAILFGSYYLMIIENRMAKYGRC